jgi:hypothetical protein
MQAIANFNATMLSMIVWSVLSGSPVQAEESTTLAMEDIHPTMFEMVLCRLSDTDQPVVTEFNLDAIRKNRNQFDFSEVKHRQEWRESPGIDGQGLQRFRLLRSHGEIHTIEYQTNSGGTLTTTAEIEFSIESRSIKIAGHPVATRVLKITSVSERSERSKH